MTDHKIVSEAEWTEARRKLLAREKELTHLQEQVAEERRALPWVKVEKDYVFDAPEGRRTLSQLFDGRSQLIVYHFMFSPDWAAGCVGCSFLSDHIDGANQHLKHHDVTYVAVSRAPLDKLLAYKKRMGWDFPWVSSAGSDFNYDYHVSFTKDEVAEGKAFYNFETADIGKMEDLHGTSVFFKDADGAIYHTYSAYARGDERSLGTYMWLGITPKGRDEGPKGNLTSWVKRHDEYGDAK
ncbi:MAG: thioredoxin family protein [Alphaproteobacteria bacterium]|nr:thioredoxin family protein [Alphaproteobacteria bacterium]